MSLGLGAERWYPDNDDDLPDIYGASCGSESFLKWVGNQVVKTVPDNCGTAGGPECHYLQGNAIITGVRLKDDDDNTNAYIHIVPIVGVDWSDRSAGQRETNGQLILNSNYSANKLDISAKGLGDPSAAWPRHPYRGKGLAAHETAGSVPATRGTLLEIEAQILATKVSTK